MAPRLTSLLFACALAIGIALLYNCGINNQLVFDDARLTDGTIFGQYGGLMQLKVRMLSYGSFVWIQNLFGEGWWKQRVFNIALHIGTALTLYALALELLQRTQWGDADKSSQFQVSLRWAARAGVALWAINPVAVYAVAYLIQRSILMATLFVALACLSFVRGLTGGRMVWHVSALVCYLLALASKEYAITAILLTVPLFVYIRRPPVRRVAQVAVGAGLILVLMGAMLYKQYGSIVATVFDEIFQASAVQLEQQKPGINQIIFPLSVINQASLFFRYGLLWLLPYVGWMSIDLRPAFPLSLMSTQIIGAFAWLGTLCGASWLVMRRNDIWGLASLCVLIPTLLFITEFSIVWLQDPFVLYRGYLWSLTLPVLFSLPLVGSTNKKLYALVLIAVAVLAASSYERIQSLRTPVTAWADASEKIDRQAPANAVGRWRPFLNLGAEAMDRGDFEEGVRLFNLAESMGEPLGSARFNLGVSLQQFSKHGPALDNFAAAEAKGFTEAALYYHRGESQYALGRFGDAYDSFTKSLTRPQIVEAEALTRLRQAEAAVASQRYDEAITSYHQLIQKSPDKQRYQVGLSMALVGKKDYPAALAILNPIIAQRPTGAAHYARALAYFYLGNRAASTEDLEIALRSEPSNPVYRGFEKMLVPPAKSTAKP